MNLSVVPRENLVDELLGAIHDPSHAVSAIAHDGAHSQVDAEQRDAQLSHVLSVAKELLLRDLHRDMRAESIMSSPAVLRDWLRLYFADLPYEVFVVLFLDSQHRVIEAEPMFRGTLTQTAVYPREVVKAALLHNAGAVAFAHNHPAAAAEPSRADEYLTATLKSALALIDVRVIDHFIVAGDQLTSLAEHGLL